MKYQLPEHAPTTRSAIIGLTAGALMISFSGVWVKLSHVTHTASAFYRVLIGGIILLLGSLWRRELHWMTRYQTGLVLICSAFFAFDLIFYHASIHFVGPGLGTILPNFQVFIMALVGAIFFKEKLSRTNLCSPPMAIAGLFLIVGLQWNYLGAQYKLGIYLGLAASVCYSGFLLSLRKLQADKHNISFFYILMVVSLITAGMIALEMIRTGDTFVIPDLQSLLALLSLGIFSQGVGWILIANALPHLRISLSAIILVLQPALAFVWDVMFFGRATSGLNWIGVVMVLTAIYMGTVGDRRSKR